MISFNLLFDTFFSITPFLLFIQIIIIIYIFRKKNSEQSKFINVINMITFLCVFITSVLNIYYYYLMETKVTENNIYMNSLNIENAISYKENSNDVLLDVSHEDANNYELCKLKYTDNITSYLTEVQGTLEYNSSIPQIKSSDIIAVDQTSGNTYSVEQLSKKELLIPYTEGDQEILFYGSYNNYYLDGECIYNFYKNNKLFMITEAIYDNGNLLSYKKVTSGTTQVGIITWNISYRENKTNYNIGVTLNYFKDDDYIKSFDLDSATPDDILSVNDFENKLKETSILEGYYNGNTSDGFFNDNTGNAYMIKFFDDGTVRMLYHGNFKNGYPDDDTGNAWDIVKNKNTNYMYYKGCFKNGGTTNSSGFIFENNLTSERINEILIQNNFESSFNLNWSNTLEN